MEAKQCTECAKQGLGPKPVSDFAVDKRASGGYSSWCKQHRNEYSRKWRRACPIRERTSWLKSGFKTRYGITLEDYEALYEQQRGACAICSRALTSQTDVARRADRSEAKKEMTAHVDHCHSSGRVRGLLCTECNTGIGQLKEDVVILRNAIAYLQQHMAMAPQSLSTTYQKREQIRSGQPESNP